MRRVEAHWGTQITLDARDAVTAATLDRVFAWFERVDERFSTWRPDSEISRLARADLGIDDVHDDVREVLARCEELRVLSGGAFDVRVGADPRARPRDGLGPIDPSGFVKGWALERAGAMLRADGARNFSINAGGDVITAGHVTAGERWRVGIQHPWERDKVAAVVAVTDLGVATSGRYERGDHILDPRTALPAVGVMSVSVVDADLARADGLATAALVMGEDGMEWLASLDVAAMAIDDDTTVRTTPGFDAVRVV